jgi:hypothetical protein
MEDGSDEIVLDSIIPFPFCLHSQVLNNLTLETNVTIVITVSFSGNGAITVLGCVEFNNNTVQINISQDTPNFVNKTVTIMNTNCSTGNFTYHIIAPPCKDVTSTPDNHEGGYALLMDVSDNTQADGCGADSKADSKNLSYLYQNLIIFRRHYYNCPWNFDRSCSWDCSFGTCCHDGQTVSR